MANQEAPSATEPPTLTNNAPIDQEEQLSLRPTVADLKSNPQLWYKIHVFIHDLRTFDTHAPSRQRLESVLDASYLGLPYFTPEEVLLLKSTVVIPNRGAAKNNTRRLAKNDTRTEGEISAAPPQTLEDVIQSTLAERLERRMKKRVENGDYRVCAAHDLSPIFEKGFGINHKSLKSDAVFMGLMRENGLELREGEIFEGVGGRARERRGCALGVAVGKKQAGGGRRVSGGIYDGADGGATDGVAERLGGAVGGGKGMRKKGKGKGKSKVKGRAADED